MSTTYAQFRGECVVARWEKDIIQIRQKQFRLVQTSQNGSPVQISAEGEIRFQKSGIHHISLFCLEKKGGPIRVALGHISSDEATMASNFIHFGTCSSDIIVNSTKEVYKLFFIRPEAYTVEYEISWRMTIRRI